MRSLAFIVVALSALHLGCSRTPPQNSEPVEVKVSVKLPSGSAQGLTVSFTPLGEGHPAAGKVGSDGTATVKAIPGKYVFFFSEEANAGVASFSKVPAAYRTASQVHTVELGSNPASIEVK